MELFEAIRKRASYRGAFLSTPIPEKDIYDILEAGILAPSGLNYQTTTFVVVKEAASCRMIADLFPTPATESAPLFIVALSEVHKPENPSFSHMSFETEDYAAAIENILLAVTAKGYATVWMDGMTRMKEDANHELRKLLNVPEKYSIRTILPVGIPAGEVKTREKKPYNERVILERFA